MLLMDAEKGQHRHDLQEQTQDISAGKIEIGHFRRDQNKFFAPANKEIGHLKRDQNKFFAPAIRNGYKNTIGALMDANRIIYT